MSAIEIIPTCVPMQIADLSRCADSIRSFVQAIHIDVDDGIFAPARTWPYSEGGTREAFHSLDLNLFMEVHLMVSAPRDVGIAFAHAGVSRIIAHIEAFADVNEAFEALAVWRASGVREVGLALLKATSFDAIEPIVPSCDVVHLMSIATIGTQGIPYDPSAPARIAEFHARFPETLISVDGGVSEKNIADLVRSGARRFGVGSAISRAPNPAAAYVSLKSVADAAMV